MSLGVYKSLYILADENSKRSLNLIKKFIDPKNLFTLCPSTPNPDPSPVKLVGKVPLGIRGAQGAFDGALGAFSPSDPLILDLNGDGVLTTALSASISLFDIDGDGFAERTEWASTNDGMLAIDTNGNGTIDNVSELFGDDTAANGIAKLKNYDLNGDNIIDANDAVYAQLKMVLRRLKWNLRCHEIRDRGGNQVDHGDEVGDVPVAPSSVPGRLEEAI